MDRKNSFGANFYGVWSVVCTLLLLNCWTFEILNFRIPSAGYHVVAVWCKRKGDDSRRPPVHTKTTNYI